PECSGQKSELRGERWSDQRPRPRDRREVVAEDDPPIGGSEVATIVESHRRRRTSWIQREDSARDELAIEPVRHRVGAERGHEEPGSVDGLSARQRQHSEAARARYGNQSPDDYCAEPVSHARFTHATKLSMR